MAPPETWEFAPDLTTRPAPAAPSATTATVGLTHEDVDRSQDRARVLEARAGAGVA